MDVDFDGFTSDEEYHCVPIYGRLKTQIKVLSLLLDRKAISTNDIGEFFVDVVRHSNMAVASLIFNKEKISTKHLAAAAVLCPKVAPKLPIFDLCIDEIKNRRRGLRQYYETDQKLEQGYEFADLTPLILHLSQGELKYIIKYVVSTTLFIEDEDEDIDLLLKVYTSKNHSAEYEDKAFLIEAFNSCHNKNIIALFIEYFPGVFDRYKDDIVNGINDYTIKSSHIIKGVNDEKIIKSFLEDREELERVIKKNATRHANKRAEFQEKFSDKLYEEITESELSDSEKEEEKRNEEDAENAYQYSVSNRRHNDKEDFLQDSEEEGDMSESDSEELEDREDFENKKTEKRKASNDNYDLLDKILERDCKRQRTSEVGIESLISSANVIMEESLSQIESSLIGSSEDVRKGRERLMQRVEKEAEKSRTMQTESPNESDSDEGKNTDEKTRSPGSSPKAPDVRALKKDNHKNR